MKKHGWFFLVSFVSFWPMPLLGKFFFEPYYSLSSTKSIVPKKGTETETIGRREEKGLRVGMNAWSWLNLSLSAGQNEQTTTSKTSQVTDEYSQIDFSKELSSSTSGKEQKKKETQNRASFQLIFNPSFSIFILQTKFGVTAVQRLLKFYIDDVLQKDLKPKPTFNPQASLAAGVKLWYQTYFLIEYGVYFYKFPKFEPFERQLTVSYGVNI